MISLVGAFTRMHVEQCHAQQAQNQEQIQDQWTAELLGFETKPAWATEAKLFALATEAQTAVAMGRAILELGIHRGLDRGGLLALSATLIGARRLVQQQGPYAIKDFSRKLRLLEIFAEEALYVRHWLLLRKEPNTTDAPPVQWYWATNAEIKGVTWMGGAVATGDVFLFKGDFGVNAFISGTDETRSAYSEAALGNLAIGPSPEGQVNENRIEFLETSTRGLSLRELASPRLQTWRSMGKQRIQIFRKKDLSTKSSARIKELRLQMTGVVHPVFFVFHEDLESVLTRPSTMVRDVLKGMNLIQEDRFFTPSNVESSTRFELISWGIDVQSLLNQRIDHCIIQSAIDWLEVSDSNLIKSGIDRIISLTKSENPRDLRPEEAKWLRKYGTQVGFTTGGSALDTVLRELAARIQLGLGQIESLRRGRGTRPLTLSEIRAHVDPTVHSALRAFFEVN